MAHTNQMENQLTLAHRYTCAWAEINTRIQSRQTVSAFFATITITGSSLILGLAFGPNKPPAGEEVYVLTGLSSGLVVLGWVLALWVRHNDAIIGLLGTFCRAIERLDDPENSKGIPAWHDERHKLIVKGRQYRKLADLATILLIAFAIAPALVLSGGFLMSTSWGLAAWNLIMFFSGLGAIWLTFRNAFRRKKIASIVFKKDENSGAWEFADPAETFEMQQKA